MDQEALTKECISLIEQYAHEYATSDTFLEYTITKKIENFSSSGPKTVTFFTNFLTTLLFSEENPEISVFKLVFGKKASKKLINYVWKTRYNMLTFLNKKEYLYKPMTKLYISLDQATNLSPKFFSKDVARTMQFFLPDLSSESIKVRNKVMVSVPKWYQLLIN